MKRINEIFVHKRQLLVRKLFVTAVIISLIIELLTVVGQHLGLYSEALGSVLGIILVVATFSFIAAGIIKTLNNLNEKQKNEELELRTFEVKDEISANEVIYHNLIENSGVVMYTTSVNGNITFCSSKALQLTGYSLEELSGMHFTALIDESCLEEVITKYKNQLRNNIEETLFEFRIRTKTGEVKWVEQSAILISENSEPEGFQCIVKEISERKEMEAVLRKYEVELVQNQDRLQSILDNATSLMYIKDLDGRYLLVNRQFKEALDVSDSTVIGKTDFDFADHAQAMRFKHSDDEVIRTGKPVQLEDNIDMVDGNHHILIMKFPLLNAKNEVYGISGIATDISERVRHEEQLIEAKRIAEDAKKLQEQFLANMSHEIRTPMNGIQGMTDLLLETNLTDEQKDFANTIKRSSDNLLVIVNDILDFSKIQAGKLTIEKIDFKLNEVLDNINAIFRHRVLEKGINLQFTVDKNIPVILNGDPFRLNQVLVNLIGNAIKFTNGGFVRVGIAVESKLTDEIFLKFSITDNGIGIPPDKINAIFESFTQASTETTRRYGGTGLGLAISKQLLEIQRGTISVESKINVGTIFTFHIPYNYSQTNGSLNFKGNDIKDYSVFLKGKRFLVAEDNEVNQKVIRHVLKKAGGFVDIANNGLKAIDFLKKDGAYDLIIMDLQMPEMDGYTATTYIRTEMKLSIPIIAMTASALKGEKNKCLEIGMNDYLTKPFDQAFLYKKISELINEVEPAKKIPFMTNEKPQNEMLFDLSLLEEMDDNEYVVEILTTYLENSSPVLNELYEACKSASFDAVYKAAHKLKGSTGLLQANSLLKILVKLEEFAKSEISDGLIVLGEQANEEYKKLENPLKEYIKNTGISPSCTS